MFPLQCRALGFRDSPPQHLVTSYVTWYACGMRLVLDTDVLVAALRSATGASRRILLAGIDQRCTLLVSPVLMFEYEAVLKRPAHLHSAGASEADVDVVLDMLAAAAERVELHYLWRPQLTDVGDEMVLETAVNGRADALVTFNTRHFVPSATRFGLAVVRPGNIVGRI
jgi:putative PIN family toxin of toxin-antitoxin system